jgi:hypothetical protein
VGENVEKEDRNEEVDHDEEVDDHEEMKHRYDDAFLKMK